MSLSAISPCFAQRHTTFTTNDGLPNDLVFKVISDQQGYIWMATMSGLVKYDGSNFRIYTVEDGLTTNDVTAIREDMFGLIWVTTLDGKLSYIEGDSIVSIPIPAKYQKNMFETGVRDDQGRLWLASRDFAVILTFENDTFREFHYINDRILGQVRVFNGIDHTVWFSAVGFLGQLGDSIPIPIYLDSLGLDLYSDIVVSLFPVNQEEIILITHKEVLFYSPNGAKILYQIAEGDNELIKSATFDSERGTMWLAQTNQIVGLDISGHELERYRFPSEVGVGSVDREGNLWIPVLRKGVYFIPATKRLLRNESYSEDSDNQQVFTMEVDSFGAKWISQRGLNGIRVDHEDNRVPVRFDLKQVSAINLVEGIYDVVDIMVQDSNTLILATDRGAYRCNIKDIEAQIPNVDTLVIPAYEMNDTSIRDWKVGAIKDQLIKDSVLYIASSSGFHILYLKNHEIKEERITYGRCTSLDLDNSGNVLVGTKVGILSYNISTGDTAMSLNSYNIKALGYNQGGTIWAGTSGFGIIVAKDGEILHKITEEEGLSTNSFHQILIDKDTIWAASNKGINRIVYSSKEDSVTQVTYFDSRDGLPSNAIISINLYGDTLYACTDMGITALPIYKIGKNPTAPLVNIHAIKVNGIDIASTKSVALSYNDNLSIAFSGVSYASMGDMRYKYKLGKNAQWFYTNNQELQYASLSPGYHVFEVYAADYKGNWSLRPASILVKVAAPPWHKPWFYACAFVVLAVLIGGVSNWRVRRIKKREAEKTELNKRIAEYKLKALHAQMNPHFIFNALHSVQSYMMDNDAEKAGLYLMKFAKLMRLVLEGSIKEKVSIAEEVKSLTYYLDLEALRFGERLKYNIEVDTIDATDKVYIPSMIIQPIVENAIIHGIAKMDGPGEVNIKFEQAGGQVICTIQDNGVGYKNNDTKDIAEGKQFPSRSSQIISEKMEAMEASQKGNLKITVENIEEEGNQGTKVTVIMILETIE